MNHSPYGQRRTNSPIKHSSPVKKTPKNHGHVPPFLAKTLYDYQLLEDDHHKIQVMPKEHLTMYILDFLESYSKQKGSSDAPATYLVSYMEKRQITKTSIKKTANSIAISLAQYQSTNHEIEFFHRIFCQTTPMVRPAANYIYSRKIVRSFYNSRHSLENLKISLGDWTTLVQKIFRDQPNAEIINRLKEKIMGYNLKRVLGTTVSPNTYHQDSNLSLRSQHQIMDIDALYFVVICVEEFQDLQTNRSPVREKSRSPPQANSFIEQNNYYSDSNKMSNYSSLKSISPPIKEKKRDYGRLKHEAYEDNSFDVLNLMRAAKEMENDPIPSLFDDHYQHQNKGNTRKSSYSSIHIQDDHEDEIRELKKQISHKTFQKRTSFGNMLSLFNLYENMADHNQDVLKFLKETQHDFATIIAKMKKQEPALSETINFGFVEKFILNLPCQQDYEKSKNIARIKENLRIKTTPTKKQTKVRSLQVSPSREIITVESTMSLKDFQPQIFLSLSERKSRQAHQKVTNSLPPKIHEDTNPTPVANNNNHILIEDSSPSENNNSQAVLDHAKQIYIEYQGGLEEIPEESQISNMSVSIASFTKEPVLADLDSSPKDELIDLTKSIEFTRRTSSIVKETIVLQEIQIEEIQSPVEVKPRPPSSSQDKEIEQTQSLEKLPEAKAENSHNNDEIVISPSKSDEKETPPSPLLKKNEEVHRNEPEILQKNSVNKDDKDEEDPAEKEDSSIQQPNKTPAEPQIQEDSTEIKLISPPHQNPLVQTAEESISNKEEKIDDEQNTELIQNHHQNEEPLQKIDQIPIQKIENEPIQTEPIVAVVVPNVQRKGDLPDPPKISLEPSLNIMKEDSPAEKENVIQQPIQKKEEDLVKQVIVEPVVAAVDKNDDMLKKNESSSSLPPNKKERANLEGEKPEAETVVKNSSSENIKPQEEEHKVEAKPAKKFAVPAFLKQNAQKPATTAAATVPDENHNKTTAPSVTINEPGVKVEDTQTASSQTLAENKNKEIPPQVLITNNNDDVQKPSEGLKENPTTTQGLQLDKLSVGSDSSKDLKTEPAKPLTPSKPKFTVPKFVKKGGAGSEKNSVQSHGQNPETGSNTSATPALDDFDVDESKKRSSSNAHLQKPEVVNMNSQNDIKDKKPHSQSHSTLPLVSDSEKILKNDALKNENVVVQQQQQPKEDPQPEKSEPKAASEDIKANVVADEKKPQALSEDPDKSKEVNPPTQDAAAKPKFAPPKFTAPKFGKKT